MPFLDAKALETDPDGMAFLRAVLRPTADKVASAACDAPEQPFQPAPPAETDKPLAAPPRALGAPIHAAA